MAQIPQFFGKDRHVCIMTVWHSFRVGQLGSTLLQTFTSCGALGRASFFIDKVKVSQLMCIWLSLYAEHGTLIH